VPSALTPGTLHIVSTPIGNLEDVTYRAIRVLRDVDLIAAEDTRRTARLLEHYEIATRCISLHEHNEARRTGDLLARLSDGQTLAMVSDAGTPLISDPGRRLARAAIGAGFRVEAIPGASAVLTALVASALAGDAFTFAGFPPVRSKARKQWYGDLAGEARPVVFFEAPHRIRASLADLEAVGGNRTIAVCREMTKVHEELVIGPILDVLDGLRDPRGEFTVVLTPPETSGRESDIPPGAELFKELGCLTESGLSRRASIRSLAAKYDVPSRRVYRAIEDAREGD
jgi:16S rRNA (cytidine1402-2'-O)-methyltransferase